MCAPVPRRRAAVIVVGLGGPVLAAVFGSRLLTDHMWFREVGQTGVFWRVLWLKVALLVGVGGVVTLFLLVTVWIAVRRALPDASRAVRLAGAATCAVLGYAVGLHAMRHWQTVMLWTHRSDFGVVDQVHHRDVGFFVFTLPLLEVGANTALGVVTIAGAAATAVYALSGALSLGPLRVTGVARTHLAVLAALALVALAWRLSLTAYSLEVSQVGSRGVTAFPGAHFVDVRLRIPGVQVLSLLTLLSAAALVAAAVLAGKGHAHAGTRLAAGSPLTAIGVAVTVLFLLPWVTQRLVVDPQPLAREQPQLLGAIHATGQAFSLDDVAVVPDQPRQEIPADELAAASGELASVQVWDSQVLIERMRQLSNRTPYFRVDRPTLGVQPSGGMESLVVFAEQELDLHRVTEQAGRWSNDRLAYTHGLGTLSFSASQVGDDGEPVAVPTPSSPRIYFGNQAPDAPAWVVANTRRPEVDSSAYHYDGDGGIALSSWTRRAAFAIRLGAPTLLLSTDITPRSRIILQRDIAGRLAALAPFIRWDPATTAAATADGRVVFIADGYTTSNRYPQAEPVRLGGEWVNYARASVRATVDAFSGETQLYLSDDTDPIARAWAAVFPRLFKSMLDFPAELRPHLRYPAALFDAQAELYERFHTQTPSAFASGAELWERPTSLSGSVGTAGNIRFDSLDGEPRHELLPAYRLAAPPASGGTKTLVRTTLYTPHGGENVVAELDGWIDGSGRPRLSMVSFPHDEVVLGPSQISRLVFTTPSITNALGLINKETTDVDAHSLNLVVLGAPHWLPFAGGILQVQPIYVAASESGVTRMLGVTVFVNGRAGMGDTLAQAIRQAAGPAAP